MKMVIWETSEHICVTNKENYYAYIQNAYSIYRLLKNEWTQEEVIEYFCKHFNCTEEDFEIPMY